MKRHFLNPHISVVVLTYNRRDEVLRTVASLLRLPERPEIVVVDNGSTDGSPHALAHAYPGLRVLRCESNLGAAARNVGAAQVSTPYVAFSDDDTDWQTGSLARAVELLERYPRIGVLSARVVVGDQRTLDPTCALMAASPLTGGTHSLPRLVGFMAGACVFRRALFDTLGGYEPRLFIGGEEALLSLDVMQAGHDIAYAEMLEVHHRPSLKRDSRLRRRMLARNAALVAWLRLPRMQAWAATWHAVRSAWRERHLAEDVSQLCSGIAWAARRRRPVAARVLQLRAAVREAERAPVRATVAHVDREKAHAAPERP
ncbi:glycosyltransferase family 2 protein [Paraburkholderia sp. J41]|uniref:glycosyltransferase family 2 protein n=1 Tax=Paraburkholderia sp. J41 TaxID=2805433 RepID=UPI002AC31EF8|nr:glycosyltransferase family 2 protein [Paraburkholderia sp. J41]